MSDYPERPGFERGSDTSEDAADSLTEGALQKLRLQVYQYVRAQARFGTTCDELEVASGLRHQTASARLRELELYGWIIKSMYRRPTRSGRMARVYYMPGVQPILTTVVAASG